MELYVRKCQNTFIEEKEYSTVWHYRNAIYEQAKFLVQELYATLNNYACTKNLRVFMGNKIAEIKNSGNQLFILALSRQNICLLKIGCSQKTKNRNP